MMDLKDWLPTTKKELEIRAWDSVDVILFSGDAYVDHPSFSAAVIGRVIESQGLRVAIIPQPNWQDDLRDFKKLGKPRLFFGVTAGNMDSMVNHYTANKRLRSDDAYTPNGKAGFRPDYATIVYSTILKKIYPDVPVVIGGIEASLRRVTHYDYWSNSLKTSILYESQADLLIYGMGEKPIIDLIAQLKNGVEFSQIKNIPQTAYITDNEEIKENDIRLFSHKECLSDKVKYAKNFSVLEEESNKIESNRILQIIDLEPTKKVLVINPTYPFISSSELDSVYDLPYTRLPHPKYEKKGTIPAFEMIKFSINLHRGCFGACSFCTISAHQGKQIISRSQSSILKELDKVSQMPDFKGYISDLGAPSANMYQMEGKDKGVCRACKKPSCIFPSVCKNLNTSHKPLIELYKKVREHKSIKKAFIGSGIRYDLIFADKNGIDYLKEVIRHHVSGRLKVAPEHTSDKVLQMMRKPSFSLFYQLKKVFDEVNQKENLRQQLIPYFISSHPACTLENMAELAAETKKLDFQLEQIQDFTPTPMTLATEMYYTGLNPYTLEKVQTAKSKEEKLAQRQFFFWYQKEYKQQIMKELQKIKRQDLIDKLFGR